MKMGYTKEKIKITAQEKYVEEAIGSEIGGCAMGYVRVQQNGAWWGRAYASSYHISPTTPSPKSFRCPPLT